ncbi:MULTISPECIES: ATP-binding cassette domain-containing protein [Lactiplantibacillus]|uniref:ATP-binding cassette domain-containing protein n=1 Tax=Lactiplantibacillus TaxID=2767842 RepID=UPI001F438180|nr:MULTISPECIES: ATP-binding cassette domain-containing protein [Lactiplantibacillus]
MRTSSLNRWIKQFLTAGLAGLIRPEHNHRYTLQTKRSAVKAYLSYQSKVVVDHIDLAIKEGSLTALLGPNGAGKTTTISMLTKILNPTSGMIKMKPDIKISMVFQQSILDNDLTVMENLSIRNKLYKEAGRLQI